MVAQLRPGLTKEQVRFILGTPLVADIFHADRWDYVYRMQHGTANAATSGKVEQRRLVVFFENGKLIRVGGDVVGEDPDAAEPPKPAARIIEIAAPKKDEAKKEEKKEEAKPEQPAPSN
jgi:outer membrane protein assembly factor BamE